MCMLTQDFVANIGSYVTNPSTPFTSFSPFISIFLLFCFLHFPSLLSYFYGSDIYPSETKVCSYNSSLSATLAVFSINHFSPNPNPFSKRKKKSNSNTINESNLNSSNLKFPSRPFPLSLPQLFYCVFFLFSHLSVTSQSIIFLYPHQARNKSL